MKKGLVFLITIILETIIILVVSLLMEWKFIDTIFLGGILIFGVHWLMSLYFNQVNNQFNAGIKESTGMNAGEIKLFKLEISPVTLGLLFFLLCSFMITIFVYSSYFFS